MPDWQQDVVQWSTNSWTSVQRMHKVCSAWSRPFSRGPKYESLISLIDLKAYWHEMFFPPFLDCWCWVKCFIQLSWWSHSRLYASLKLNSFMYLLLVLNELTLWTSLVITFPAWDLHSLIYLSLLSSKMILCRFIVFTFPAWKILSFMNWLTVSSGIALWRC